MLLFIFESLGTSELILIGIVALIFLGPRKLPEIARKIGKMMAEFRTTTQEFKNTWEREVNFEEEKKALDLDLLEIDDEEINSIGSPGLSEQNVEMPEIRQIDKERFDQLVDRSGTDDGIGTDNSTESVDDDDLLSDKRNWL